MRSELDHTLPFSLRFYESFVKVAILKLASLALLLLLVACSASVAVNPTPEPIADPASIPAIPPLSAILLSIESRTDAQANVFLRELVGKRISSWGGVVCEVEEFSGNYTVQLSVDQDNDMGACSPEIYWPVTEEEALTINLGDEITLSGIVEEVAGGKGYVQLHLEQGWRE